MECKQNNTAVHIKNTDKIKLGYHGYQKEMITEKYLSSAP